ncbi:MAG: hypothetical protein GXP45_07240 [bacterium]|nr:hypothetical protein [bacterium]
MDKLKAIMKMTVDTQQTRPFSFKPYFFRERDPLNSKEKIEIIKQISALKR